MKVAIVHHHLEPGGVTQVIRAASAALAEAGIPHVILSGSPAPQHFADLPVRVVEGLGYATLMPERAWDAAPHLVARMRTAATEALGVPPEVWHFHNHSLGKNPRVSEAARVLAEAGERVVLQIHDLAEDGRPVLHAGIPDKARLYPFAERVRLAFINRRDHADFLAAGLPTRHACLLPNPVDLDPLPPAPKTGSPLLFAPIRGIRRKNLGELLLLAALAPPATRIAVSRAPRDPAALAIHERWRALAASQRLPVEFAVSDRIAPHAGAGTSFHDWLHHATHIVGTSVAEGFGLPWVEAVAWGRPFLGRTIRERMAEQLEHGLRVGRGYGRLLVPMAWVEPTRLERTWHEGLARHFAAYGEPLDRSAAHAAFARLADDGRVDFGCLPESFQESVLERIVADPSARRIPLVEAAGGREVAADWLARAIADRDPLARSERPDPWPWSLARYRDALTHLYHPLATAPREELRFVDARRVLQTRLEPAAFHPLLGFPAAQADPTRRFRAAVFDIYGTLLRAPAGGVKPDPEADSRIRAVIAAHGHRPPDSPSEALHRAVRRHHADSPEAFPEVDLRELWRDLLGLPPGADTAALTLAIQQAWHTAQPMPDAASAVLALARSGMVLGLLSNAQCDTLGALGSLAEAFDPGLTLLSYHHGIAKPSPALFDALARRLAVRGILPRETLFVGNDPLQDIAPARAAGFATALFTGHPESRRPGPHDADRVFQEWTELVAWAT